MRKILISLLLVSIFLFTGCVEEKIEDKTLTCTKDNQAVEDSDIKYDEEVILNFEKNEIKTIKSNLLFKYEDKYEPYMEEMKSEIEKSYKDSFNENVKYNVEIVDKLNIKVTLDIDYMSLTEDDKKELEMDNSSEKYEDIKKDYEDEGYACK